MDEKAKFLTKQTFCCDPFTIHKKLVKKGLRTITKDLVDKFDNPEIKYGQKICSNCRIKVYKYTNLSDKSSESASTASEEQGERSLEDDDFIDQESELSLLNESIAVIGESPFKKQKLNRNVAYIPHKTKKIEEALVKKIQIVSPESKLLFGSNSAANLDNSDGTEIINQLKEKFAATEKRCEKIQILTVLPKSWSVDKIQNEFNVTDYMARQSKKLVSERGVLSLPNKRKTRLPEELVNQIRNFYKNDEVSRIMAGKKDYKSVKKHGKRVHEQKHLLLCNLKELYKMFKSKNSQIEISFSKFAELRPKECVLVGGAGTHTVCVCTIHQNMKLMIYGAGMSALTKEEKFHLHDYHQCLTAITCERTTTDCYLCNCLNCNLLMDELEIYLHEVFNKNMIDDVQYKQWLATDRTTLEKTVKTAEEFIETFCSNLKALKRHDYIAKEQSRFCSERKKVLKDGEMLVIGDFSENYAFILQDAAQGFHWNNAQATLHPFVCYYRQDNEELAHINVVLISDCMKHDTVAVHLFQMKLINFLKVHLTFQIEKMIYFSDGAVSQYKNFKNFTNLCYHSTDFGIKAEWHFFATSHGKGPCDGLGGTIKRLAARASLQRPYNDQIMTPKQLFEYGTNNIPGINFLYASTDEWVKEEKELQARFVDASTVPGTQKLHCFVPLSLTEIEVKTVSSAKHGAKRVRVRKDDTILLEDIKGFVTAVYDNKWWLACVLQTYPENMQVKLTFLEPEGPSTSFKYPLKSDILTIFYKDILSIVEPITVTGRTYSLKEAEIENANQMLKKHSNA